MLRIMTADEPGLTMITVDGELAGDYLEAVEASCDRASSKGKPVWLFLREISVIGEDGRALLRRLATKGVRLTASGLCTSYVVQLIQSGPLPQARQSNVYAPRSEQLQTSLGTPRVIGGTTLHRGARFDRCLDTCLDT